MERDREREKVKKEKISYCSSSPELPPAVAAHHLRATALEPISARNPAISASLPTAPQILSPLC